MQDKDAIIIGSGVAGMAAATRLAVLGYRVTVYEKNSVPGGKMTAIHKDGYTFDSGPSLFTDPGGIEELFEFSGEQINDYLQWKPVDVACRYFFENGKKITSYTNKDQFIAELEEKVNEPAQNTSRYLSRTGTLYRHVGSVFLNYSLHRRNTWFHPRIFKAISSVSYPLLFRTMDKYNVKRFRSQEARQIFNRFATYNGSNPYKAPAMLSMISSLEHNDGVFYPEGGMASITNALYQLALKKGVSFHFDTPVDRIIHHEGVAKGVVVNGKNIAADVIVSNGDIYFTYKNLLHHNKFAAKIARAERSSSALVFYWGMNRTFPELDLHNIFFSGDYAAEFKCIQKKTISTDPTVYVNITSKMQDGHAPSGKENWFVMVNAPSNSGQDWEQLQQRVRVNVIEKLSRQLGVDISECIETEILNNPVMLEQQTGSYQGSLYGSSSNSKMAAFFRPANFSSYVKNLYFCGGSVHPGGGIPLCLKSAKITAGLIDRSKKNKSH